VRIVPSRVHGCSVTIWYTYAQRTFTLTPAKKVALASCWVPRLVNIPCRDEARLNQNGCGEM
jgi:hypothetical protein